MPEKPAPDLEALLRYTQKRDFAATPEPATGRPDPAAKDLTFVVQQHRATRMHWDFRLEIDDVLASWAVPRGPSLNPKDKRMAAMTEDHPFNNKNFYGATKICGEAMARAYHHRYGLNFVGLRYMNVYGPRQDYRGAYIAVIMRMLDAIDRGEGTRGRTTGATRGRRSRSRRAPGSRRKG